MNSILPSQDNEQEQWQSWLKQFSIRPDKPLQARTFRRAWKTKSMPVWLKCEDGNDYIVKGQQAGRQIVNDQIIAHLGTALGAPVGQPKIIEIVPALVELEPKHLAHIPLGTAHGTRFIHDCMDSYTLIATSEDGNRPRLMLLAILYGWVFANDHQFLFNNYPPRLIHSVDHGHFFPNGPDWKIEDLKNTPKAQLDPYFADCHFTLAELKQGRKALEQVTEKKLIQAVASPPDQWQLTIEERIALVEYLAKRKQELLTGDLRDERQSSVNEGG